jgi:hypothetical protein
MTADDTPRPITLPAITVIQLADLLTELDEFLRSGSTASDALAAYLASRGHLSPGYQVSLLIDDVSFTAAHLRSLTDGIDKAAAEHAHLAGYFGEDHQQGT